MYTSSVEMVTTPEEYPVWRTRHPVVVVLHHDKRTVQHHYYRYLVVSPGGTASMGGLMHDSLVEGAAAIDAEEQQVSTSNEAVGSTPVVQWEDPFNSLLLGGGGGAEGGDQMRSSVSLPSVSAAQPTRSDYRSLPYRVVDINVLTGQADFSVDDASSGGGGGGGNSNWAPLPRLDRWNVADDASFRSYRIREAVWTVVLASPCIWRYIWFVRVCYGLCYISSFTHLYLSCPCLLSFQIHSENRRKLQQRISEVSGGSSTGELGTMEGMAMMASASSLERPPPKLPPVGPPPPPPPPPTAVPQDDSAMQQDLDTGNSTPTGFPSANRIFFICFHLPVVVVQNKNTKVWRASWSESILAKTEGSQILATYQAYWVGTVTTHPPLENDEDRAAVKSLLSEMNCIPIFLDTADRQAHYYGFCKQVLWPAFHNIDLLDLSTSGWLSAENAASSGEINYDASVVVSDWDQSRLDDWWKSYVRVTAEFRDLMSGIVRPGDILWIHDYHLSLLPKMVSEWEDDKYGGRVTRKVFFLHIPFPTSQIFRELECGESILQGMLHADVVGFHAFDHARHFLNASKRILGLNYESIAGGLIGVSYHGRTLLISMSNVSVEPRMVEAALMLPSVTDGRNAIKKKHEGRIILGGLDIGQRLSGTALKLLAYERLLQDYPVWQSRVVMVQRILVPGSRKADELSTTRELRGVVKRIVDKFGPAVIDYEEYFGTATLPMDQRLALWRASDVLVCTPIREGLNHWPMEYIFAHKDPEVPGVVITSEFSAVASILNGALRVNPFDIQNTIITIDKALSMELQEREGRRYRDIDFVSGSPSDKWVRNVLRDLRDATAHQQANRAASESNSQAATPLGGATPRANKMNVDSTAAFLAQESNYAFAQLSFRALQAAYNASKRRVIFTDFNGTIVMKEPPGKYLKREILGTSGNTPPHHVIDALATLTQDPRNTVYVVSGDAAESVVNALGHVPGLGLAVSNGARFLPPARHGETVRRWLTFDLGVDWDAVKRVALPVLSKYTARSNGSFVKLTSESIGWSYYSCDPEWGALQAAHLVLELENELRAFDVRFVTLKGIIEIVPRKLNKGLIVKRVLRDIAAQYPDEGVDFVLCFGDDISDEKMFTSVYSFISELGDQRAGRNEPPIARDDGRLLDAPQFTTSTSAPSAAVVVPDPLYSFTVAVGKKPSHASTYVNGPYEVHNALVMLATGQVPAAGGAFLWDRSSHSMTSNEFE
jgi:trehalose 6-phosphate synthase/phosphatase